MHVFQRKQCSAHNDSVLFQTGIALFASGADIDLVSQFFLEQMLGLGYFATSITFNILAVRLISTPL